MMRKGIGMMALLLLGACNQPQVLEAEQSEGTWSNAAQQIFNSESTAQKSAHSVHVIDTLNGSRYSYLKVKEEGKEFWLATLKAEYQLGKDYRFQKGLYKTDYYSTEFNRSFKEIYLVSDLRPAFSTAQEQALDRMFQPEGQKQTNASAETELVPQEGSISIKELIQNAEDYVGQSVQLTARVVKINANIMDRHWLHLQDGSFDSFDMVATSQTAVPNGHVVTIQAVLNRDVDFGAGYSYDLILENAEVIP